ncbi:hypothetical protein, partial [Escherichia coli]|uniref:hypothetical protein n=1 Tax=Escherichia coli TaxID=562 RepID=UPI001BFE39BB
SAASTPDSWGRAKPGQLGHEALAIVPPLRDAKNATVLRIERQQHSTMSAIRLRIEMPDWLNTRESDVDTLDFPIDH